MDSEEIDVAAAYGGYSSRIGSMMEAAAGPDSRGKVRGLFS